MGLALFASAPVIAGQDAENASAAGDAAMQLRRPAEAIVQYRLAKSLGFRDSVSLATRIAGAEAQRQRLLRICDNESGELARRACLAARLQGAPDEARVMQRLARIDAGAVQAAPPRARVPVNSSTLESDSFSSATETRYSNAAEPSESH